MKKSMIIAAVCLVILISTLLCLLFGCVNNSDNPQDDNTSNVEDNTQQEEEILPTSIILKLDQNSAWTSEEFIIYRLEILPENATNKTVTITSSNENVAWSDGHESRLYVGEAGTTIFTATTANGLTSSVNFEVKSLIKSLPEMPSTYSMGSGSTLRKYKLTSVSFDTPTYSGSIILKFSGEKIYDGQGENHIAIDSVKINLYDKDNYLVDTQYCYFDSLLLNDKFKDKKVIFRSAFTTGAPYTIKIVV